MRGIKRKIIRKHELTQKTYTINIDFNGQKVASDNYFR